MSNRLSAYARQFLERMDKPDVDEIIGIAPAIAIRQKNQTQNPRSTVATQTEIYDYLRLLYARVGQTFCHVCGNEVKKDSPESAADEILAVLETGTRFYVLFPAEHQEEVQSSKSKVQSPIPHLMSLMQQGFTRLFRNGETIDLQKPEDYPFADFENTFVIIDRLKADEEIRQRLVDSLETCFRENGSAVILTAAETPQTLNFSEKFICKYDGTIYDEPEPQLFSFNSPFGACATCQGFGNTIGIDYDLVVPNPLLSLKKNAIDAFSRPSYAWARKELMLFAQENGVSIDVPYADLEEWQKKAILHGRGKWRGVDGFFKWLETKKYKLHVRVFLSKYRGYALCPDCHGARLRQAARDVKIGGKSLPEIVALSIKDAQVFFDELKMSEEREQIAEKLLLEIRRRIKFLVDVGLDYLTLDRLGFDFERRRSAAHSIGDKFRFIARRRACMFWTNLQSVCIRATTTRLIKILENLRDIGNTVLVVEHDEEMMRVGGSYSRHRRLRGRTRRKCRF